MAQQPVTVSQAHTGQGSQLCYRLKGYIICSSKLNFKHSQIPSASLAATTRSLISMARVQHQKRSAFWELIVLPTFAPHLARPYRVPGMTKVYNSEFAHPCRLHRSHAKIHKAKRRAKGRTVTCVYFLELLSSDTYSLPHVSYTCRL
jgi:hypothetical protein